MGQTCPDCGTWSEIVYTTGDPEPLYCPHCGEFSERDEWIWDEDEEDEEQEPSAEVKR